MVFSSIVFLFLFLPVVATAYFLVPRGARNVLLLAASLFFYAWGETTFVFVMLASIALNYGFGLWIGKTRGTARARLPLVLAVLVNLELLALYKYSTFFIDNLNVAIGWFGAAPILLEGRHLPAGISFFTFQAMSYVIDVYRNEARPQKNPLNLVRKLFTTVPDGIQYLLLVTHLELFLRRGVHLAIGALVPRAPVGDRQDQRLRFTGGSEDRAHIPDGNCLSHGIPVQEV